MRYGDRIVDGNHEFDYGRVSADYARFRPGPPDRYYDCLANLGIGRPKQRILDVGTGTGVIARALARRGSIVSALDISKQQIALARGLAAQEGLSIDFQVGPAECPPKLAGGPFDVAVGNQCFLYLNTERVMHSLRPVMASSGRLVISHYRRLATDSIVLASESLIRKFNSGWEGAGFDGEVEAFPEWVPKLPLLNFFWFDVDVPFSRDSWRGRMRASRGVGASLSSSLVRKFDLELAKLLDSSVPERFVVKHRIDVRVLFFSGPGQLSIADDARLGHSIVNG